MQKYKKLSIFAYKLKVNIQQRFYFVIFFPLLIPPPLMKVSAPRGARGGGKTIKGCEELETIEG